MTTRALTQIAIGLATAQMPPITKKMPNRIHTHFQPGTAEATRNCSMPVKMQHEADEVAERWPAIGRHLGQDHADDQPQDAGDESSHHHLATPATA